MITCFKITKKEKRDIQDWLDTHECSIRTSEYGIENERYAGAIGGNTTFSFTPTGLGTVIIVKCSCGETKNFTDYGSW